MSSEISSANFLKITILGSIWTFLKELVTKGLALITTLFLALLLMPEDFGTIGIAVTIVTLLNFVVDCGFKQSLIRSKKLDQLSHMTAISFNFILSIILYIALFFSSPAISNFFEIDITQVLRIMGLQIIFISLYNTHEAILIRNLEFKKILNVTLPASVISSIFAVILAINGYGVYALVAQTLVYHFINFLIFWVYAPLKIDFAFSKTIFKKYYNFGWKISVIGIIDTLFSNLLTLLLVKFYSLTVAGTFFLANKIYNNLVKFLISSVQSASYPTLAKARDDRAQTKNHFQNLLKTTTSIFFPVVVFLFFFSESFFEIFFEDQWALSGTYMSLLSIRMVLYPALSLNYNILKIYGKSNLLLILELFKKFLLAICIFSFWSFGIEIVILSMFISSLLGYLLNIYLNKAFINYSLFEQIKDIAPQLLISVLSGLLASQLLYSLNFSLLINTSLSALLFFTLYVLFALLLVPNFKLFLQLIFTRRKG